MPITVGSTVSELRSKDNSLPFTKRETSSREDRKMAREVTSRNSIAISED